MAPALNQEDEDVSISLTDELTELCAARARARFSDVARRERMAAAGDFARYRFRDLGGDKLSTKDDSRFSSDGIRRAEKE